jgi:hypothetical protein
MKLMSFTAPVLIVALTAATLWGMGMLAVRASAVSTQTSIELLRMHLRVERLHDQLLRHSRELLTAELRSRLPGAVPQAEAGVARPWPEETAP